MSEHSPLPGFRRGRGLIGDPQKYQPKANRRQQMKRRRFAQMAAAVTLALTSLTAGSGVAHADAWYCGWSLTCTTAVYDAGVYTVPNGAYMYTVPAGALVEITCYGYGAGNAIWYKAGRAGWRAEWMSGHSLATGHDPNPLVGYCY
jgi:hypothetical protein